MGVVSWEVGDLTEFAQSLAHRLVALRQRAGFANQRALADACGVKQSTISDLEAGRTTNPRVGTLQQLASALGVSLGQLLDGELPEDPRETTGRGSLEPDAVRLRQPPEDTAGADLPIYGLVELQVTSRQLTGLNIHPGFILTVDLGGTVGTRQVVAYVSRDEPEPFMQFFIRHRVRLGMSLSTYRSIKRVGFTSYRPSFSGKQTAIDEQDGLYRHVGPVLSLKYSFRPMDTE